MGKSSKWILNISLLVLVFHHLFKRVKINLAVYDIGRIRRFRSLIELSGNWIVYGVVMSYHGNFFIVLFVFFQKLFHTGNSFSHVLRSFENESFRHELQNQSCFLCVRCFGVNLLKSFKVSLLIFGTLILDVPEITLFNDIFKVIFRISLDLSSDLTRNITWGSEGFGEQGLNHSLDASPSKKIVAGFEGPLQRGNQNDIRVEWITNFPGIPALL